MLGVGAEFARCRLPLGLLCAGLTSLAACQAREHARSIASSPAAAPHPAAPPPNTEITIEPPRQQAKRARQPVALVSTKPQAALPLIPLQVSNRWTYTQATYDRYGKLVMTDTVTAEVLEEREIAGQLWYRYDELGASYWVRNTPEGQYEASVGDSGNIEEQTLFFRVQAEALPHRYGTPHSTVTLESRNASVTTAAGEFRCYLYHVQEPDLEIDIYLAPGIGLVKNHLESSSEISVTELRDYHIASQP